MTIIDELLTELATSFEKVSENLLHAVSVLKRLEELAALDATKTTLKLHLEKTIEEMRLAVSELRSNIAEHEHALGHLPVKEKAKHPGFCYECGLMIYVGDWIIRYTVGDNSVASHAEHIKVMDKGIK